MRVATVTISALVVLSTVAFVLLSPISPFKSASLLSSSSSDDIEESYDYIFIGSGPSSAVAASRLLAQNPSVKVLMLEAGTNCTGPNIEIPFNWPVNIGSYFDWGFWAQPDNAEGATRLPRGYCIGGSTKINALNVLWGNHQDYDDWGISTGTSDVWSWATVDAAYRQLFNFTQSEFSSDPDLGKSGPIHVTTVPYVDQIAVDWKNQLLSQGFTYQNPNGATQFSVSATQKFQRDGVRRDAQNSFIDQMLALYGDRFTLLPNSPAIYIDVHEETESPYNMKAFGVIALINGVETKFIRVEREVLLGAGALMTPALLMRSGIGDPAVLQAANIATKVNLPAVGKNLMDHPLLFHIVGVGPSATKHAPFANPAHLFAAIAQYDTDHTGPFAVGGGQYVAYLKRPWSNATQPEIEVLFQELNPTPGQLISDAFSLVIVGPLRPKSVGQITLQHADPTNVQANIVRNYWQDPEGDDVDIVRYAIRWSRQVVAAMANGAYDPIDIFPPASATSDADLAAIIRSNPFGSTFHYSGTCAIGTCVDKYLRVIGVDGLRVIDTSVFPRVISGHTGSPAYMTGFRVADFIHADH